MGVGKAVAEATAANATAKAPSLCAEGYYRVNLSTPLFMPGDYIVLVTDETEDAPAPIDGQRGWGEEVRKRISSFREVRLPVVQLEQNMNQFLQLVERLFK